jgi:hypothetical protein
MGLAFLVRELPSLFNDSAALAMSMYPLGAFCLVYAGPRRVDRCAGSTPHLMRTLDFLIWSCDLLLLCVRTDLAGGAAGPHSGVLRPISF